MKKTEDEEQKTRKGGITATNSASKLLLINKTAGVDALKQMEKNVTFRTQPTLQSLRSMISTSAGIEERDAELRGADARGAEERAGGTDAGGIDERGSDARFGTGDGGSSETPSRTSAFGFQDPS